MLSSTVYQGKRAGSWKTTAGLGAGLFAGAPSTKTWPRVGVSKPATMLSSVDLPQPLGPRMAANSLGSTAKSMACSASTLWPRLLNSLKTEWSVIAGSAMGLQRPPPEHQPRQADDDTIRDEAEQADREHRGHADVHPPHVVRVPQHVAQPRLHRDHLGHDHRRPRHAHAEAEAREDRRERRRQHDLAQDRRLARAQHARGTQEKKVGVADAVRGVDDDRIEGAERDQEERAGVVDAEHRDRERQPRRDRHGPEELNGWIDDARDQAVPADEEPERDADAGGADESVEGPSRGVDDVRHPGAGIGREAEPGLAEDPALPGLRDLGRRGNDSRHHPLARDGDVPQPEQQERQQDEPRAAPRHRALPLLVL